MADENNEIYCCLCLDEFTKPKIINCFHTFCEKCLKDYVVKFTRKKHFPCPLCRQNIKVPANGVDGFSSNFYIKDKSEHINKRRTQGKELCVDHNKELELYCRDCMLTACSKCFVVSHNGHHVGELETINKADRSIELIAVKQVLENTISKCDRYLTLTEDYKNLQKTELDKVDRQVENICLAVRSLGERTKEDISSNNMDTSVTNSVTDVSLAMYVLKNYTKQIDECFEKGDFLKSSSMLNWQVRNQIDEINNGEYAIPKTTYLQYQERSVNILKILGELGTFVKENLNEELAEKREEIKNVQLGKEMEGKFWKMKKSFSQGYGLIMDILSDQI